MSKTVKVTYNADTFETTITIDGNSFDTTRINGKKIADWAYPFMIRKVKWNGFYEEMVEALDGDKEFNLIFDGSEEALEELKEAWEDAPVTVITKKEIPLVKIIYDEKTLKTVISIDDEPFDTSRINGMEIEDWIYPYMVRKTSWDGIFAELEAVIGSDSYTIQFIGDMKFVASLKAECPSSVIIVFEEKESLIVQLCIALSNKVYYINNLKKCLHFSPIDERMLIYMLAHIDAYRKRASKLVPKEFWQKYEQEVLEKSEAYEKSNETNNDSLLDTDSEDHSALAEKYYYGRSVKKSPKKALKHCKLALEQDPNDATAAYLMGKFYLGADGIAKDLEEAIKWFQKSKDYGYEKAQQALDDTKQKCADEVFGDGAWEEEQGNYDKAFELFQKSADLGSAKANNWLGLIFSEEKRAKKFGKQIDIPKALEYFKVAADDGFEAAMYNIGVNLYYENNEPYQAVEWLEKVINAGHEDAKEMLDNIYASISENKNEATYDPEEHKEYYFCYYPNNFEPYKEMEKNFIYSLFFYYPAQNTRALSALFRDYNSFGKTGKGKYADNSDYYNQIYKVGYPDFLIVSEETENERAKAANEITNIIMSFWGKNPITAFLSYFLSVFKDIENNPDYFKSKFDDNQESTVQKVKSTIQRFESLLNELKKDFNNNKNSIFSLIEDISRDYVLNNVGMYNFYRTWDIKNDSKYKKEIRKSVFLRLLIVVLGRIYEYAISCISDGILDTDNNSLEKSEDDDFFDSI